jgi:hypothetical protein
MVSPLRNKTNRNPLLAAKHMPNHNRESRKPENGGHVFVADANHHKKPEKDHRKVSDFFTVGKLNLRTGRRSFG